jgi:hypothetical protein
VGSGRRPLPFLMGKKDDKQKRDPVVPASVPMVTRERLRNQWEALDQVRRALEDTEKSVRYALLIFGVLNTMVFLLLTRRQDLGAMSGWARSGTTVLDITYAVVAVAVLVFAIRALHPSLHPWEVHFRAASTEPVWPAGDAPDGVVLFRDVLKYSSQGYRQAWRNLTDEQLSGELASLAYLLAGRAHRKHENLRRLYGGLGILLALGAAMFLVAGLFTVFNPPS